MSRPRLLSHANARELFPTLAFGSESFLFYNEDNTLSFGFLCQPLYGGDDALAARINVLLNLEWPDESILQFCLFTSPDIEPLLANVEMFRRSCKDKLLMDGILSRVKFLRESTERPIDEESGTRVRDIQILVTGKVPVSGALPSKKDYKMVNDLRRSCGQSLASAHFCPINLDANLYIRIMQTILNWGPEAGWKQLFLPEWDQTQTIRDQFLDYGKQLKVDVDGLWLDEKRVNILSVKRYPDSAYFGTSRAFLSDVMHGARGIRENVIISASLHFKNSEKTRSTMGQKRQWTVNQAVGPLAKFVPILTKKQKGFDVLFDALQDGDRTISFYLGMAIFTDSRDQGTSAVSNAKGFWRDQGFQIMEDKFFCLPLFLNMLPMVTDPKATSSLFRYKTFATRHVVPMLPIFSSWQGTGTPTLNLISRDGQPMNYCSFDSETNYSTIIAATSGAGKSFLVNDLVWSYLSTGGQFWIFDIGKSYKNICSILGGTFMEFSEGNNICLNVFEMVTNWEEDADMLASLICIMASANGHISDLQSSEIKRTLKIFWDSKGRNTSINDVSKALLENPIPEVSNVGRQLYPFTSEGEYGKYFNGKNNVDLSNRFCVLEMEELSGRKHLQKVVLLTLMFQIQQNMYLGDRDRNKICMVDEAWAMIAGDDETNGDVGKVMAGFARKARKYGGALFIATQSLFDLYQNQVGKAIVDNAANKLLLMQNPSNIEELRNQKKLDFNDFEYDLLKTVHTKRGVYSEVYCITDKGKGIGRLFVEDFKKILYSTSAKDVDALVLRTQFAKMDTADAVNDYLRELGRLEGKPQYNTGALAAEREVYKRRKEDQRLAELEEREQRSEV